MRFFTVALVVFFYCFIAPLHSVPTPLLHQSHLLKHPISTNVSQPEEYVEVTRPLPFDSLHASCKFPILAHNFSNTVGLPPFRVPYFPPLDCNWSHVVLEIQVSSHGEQYDRIAAVWLSGVELIRTSTAEPTDDGVFWTVRKDVTRYSSLLAKDRLILSVMLENIVNKVFTGVYQVKVTFLYYDIPGPPTVSPLIALPRENDAYYRSGRKLTSFDNPLNLGKEYIDFYDRPADSVIPISADGDDGFWFRIQNELDIHSKEVRIPRNTYRAVIEVYSSAHGNDEFWYSNPPDAYAYLLSVRNTEAGRRNPPFPCPCVTDTKKLVCPCAADTKKLVSERGHGTYREVLVKIDGNLVGSVIPFPVIFTGGINPLFWEPVVGIGAFDLPSYDIELTPFIGLLLDGNPHSISLEVAEGISFWLVDANLHLWLDAGSLEVEAGIDSSEPEFSLERESRVNGLDGEFEIESKRTTKVSGWLKMAAGEFSTSFEQKLKFKNTIRFSNDGTVKSVEQKVKDERELKIKSSHGPMIFHTITKSEYPLKIDTETLPPNENNAYVMRSRLENSIEEKKKIEGAFSKHLKNKQESSGWMSVKDQEVISGSAKTEQHYSFNDGSECYSRIVAAEDGTILNDDTDLLCVHP